MFLTQLQSDLRDLSLEARKKDDEVKEAAERAAVRVRAIGETAKELAAQAELIAKHEEVSKAFIAALETNQMKLIEIAVVGMNRLIQHKALAPSLIRQVIRLMSDNIMDLNLLLKPALCILQMMVALLTPSNYTIHQDDLARAFGVCFKLYTNQKLTPVHQPAEASLRQVCSMLIDRTYSLWIEVHGRSHSSSSSSSSSPTPAIATTTATPTSATSASDNTTASAATTATEPNSAVKEETETKGNDDVTSEVPQDVERDSNEATDSVVKETIQKTSTSDASGATPNSTAQQAQATPSVAASQLSSYILDTTRLLRDLVNLLQAQPTIWLPVTGLREPSFGFELFDEVLSGHYNAFIEIPEYHILLRDSIGPCIAGMLERRTHLHNYAPVTAGVAQSTGPSSSPSASASAGGASQDPAATNSAAHHQHNTSITVGGSASSAAATSSTGSNNASSGSSQQQQQPPHHQHQWTWSFSHTVRLLRVVSVILMRYHTSVPLSVVQSLFDGTLALLDSNVLWHRTVALEVVRSVLTNEQSLFSLAAMATTTTAQSTLEASGEESTAGPVQERNELCARVINKLGRFAQALFEWSSSDFVLRPLSKTRYVDQLTHTDVASQITPSYVISTLLTCYTGMIDLLSNAAEEAQTGGDTVRLSLSKHITLISWPSVLNSLSLMVAKTRDEGLTQLVLKGYQSFTRLCGRLQLATPRDAFLTSLCKFAKPSSLHILEVQVDTIKLSKKNALGLKTLLNIAHTMTKYLTEAGWSIVLDTLHQLYVLLHAHAAAAAAANSSPPQSTSNSNSIGGNSGGGDGAVGPSGIAAVMSSQQYLREQHTLSSSPTQSPLGAGSLQQSGSSGGAGSASLSQSSTPAIAVSTWSPSEELATREEEEILLSTLESLFSSPALGDLRGLTAIVKGLVTLSKTRLSELNSMAPLKEARIMHICLFGLAKMFQIARSDITRLPLMWDILASHVLGYACVHKNPDVRTYACRELCSLVESAIATLPADVMQVSYMEAMEMMVTSVHAHADVRLQTLECLYRVLQNSGQLLSAAWTIILPVLMSVGLDTTETQLVPVAFKSLQLVVADYLPVLPIDCISVCISTIGCYGGKSVADVNINITAVGLLWNVADFLAREQSRLEGLISQRQSYRDGAPGKVDTTTTTERLLDSLWVALFQELSARADNRRSEIRNGSLQILYSTITTYGASCLSSTTWYQLVDTILLPSLEWVRRQTDAAAERDRRPASPSPAESPSSSMTSKEPSPSSSASSSSSGGGGGLLVHHSRNTEAKQWHETQVILISGLVRVFRSFLDTLLTLESAAAIDATRSSHTRTYSNGSTSVVDNTTDGTSRSSSPSSTDGSGEAEDAAAPTEDIFTRMWGSLVRNVEQMAVCDTIEVALAAVGSMKEILIGAYTGRNQSASGNAKSSASLEKLQRLSKEAWEAWRRVAAHAVALPKVSHRLLTCFVDGITELHTKLDDNFSLIDLENMLSVMSLLPLFPLEYAGELSILQKQILALMLSLVDGHLLPNANSKSIQATLASSTDTTSLGGTRIHRLVCIPQIVSILLGYISRAIGFAPHFVPTCYISPTATTAALSSPESSPPSSSSDANSSSSHWNATREGLDRRLLPLCDKAVPILAKLWNGLIALRRTTATSVIAATSSTLPTDNITEDSASEEGVAASPVEDEVPETPSSSNAKPTAIDIDKLVCLVFPDMVLVLGHVMQLRSCEPSMRVWGTAAELFCATVRDALPVLSSSDVAVDQSAPPLLTPIELNLLWTNITDSIESFLLNSTSDDHPHRHHHHHSHQSDLHTQQSSDGNSPSDILAAQLDLQLVDLVALTMVPACPCPCPPTMNLVLSRLFALLFDGAAQARNEQLMRSCLARVFGMVHRIAPSDGTTKPSIIEAARTALPLLMSRSRSLLQGFISDDRLALPVATSRLRQVCTLLQHLCDLYVSPALWELAEGADSQVKVGQTTTQDRLPTTYSPSYHLFMLYPELCDCITTKEQEIKPLLRAAFLRVGQGLVHG